MTSANLTDVPSYTGALPSVLAGAGIHRFFGIANHIRGGNAESDVLHLLSPVRWEGPDGAQVTTFFADCYTQLRTVCSDQPSVFGAAAGLTRLLERYERADYPHADLPLYGTHADNEDLGSGYADLVDRWAREFSWPRIRYSTIDDYFDAVEDSGGELPIVKGDGGAFWEDGVGTAPQLHSAHRALQSRLPEIEAVSALVTSQSTVLRADTGGLDSAWRGILVGGEHTFTASYGTDAPHAAGVAAQIQWKWAQLERATADAEDLRLRSMAQLADQIDVQHLPSVLVVNPLSWSRGGVIELELPAGHGLRAHSGDVLPAVLLGSVEDGRIRTRVALPSLPAFGYEVYSIVPVTRDVSDQEVVVSDGDLEIGSYVLHVEDGAVRQLTDRRTGRTIFDESGPRRAGDIVVVHGGGTATGRGRDGERSSLWDYDPHLPAPTMSEVTAVRGPLTMRPHPSGAAATLAWTATVAGVLTGRIELSVMGDEIDVLCDFVKQPEFAKQSVYVAFPFRAGSGTWFDRQQGEATPDHMLPGAGVDWFTNTNAVVLGEGDDVIAWASKDAALVVFDEPVSGQWRTHDERQTGTVLSWVTNNYWFTNTLASQQGEMRFRYRFVPGCSGERATRMGRELRSDLWVSEITVADRRDPWPRPREPRGSLWEPGGSGEIEITVFASRFHEGALLVRVQELTGTPVQAILRLPVAVGADVFECNDVEDVIGQRDIVDRTLDIDLRPFQVRSFLFTDGTDR